MTRSPSRSRGFTIIEAIGVMVILGIAAASIVSIQGGIFARRTTVNSEQIRREVLMECAEQVMGVRMQLDGYNQVSSTRFGTNNCDNGVTTQVTAVSPFTIPTVAFPVDANVTAACPNGALCKAVTITSGDATLTVMLADVQ